MWWVTSQKNGASALGLQRILGLGSYRTAWALLHKLRRAMVRPGREQLAGRVEVDETYVGEEEGVRAQSHWDASPSAAVGQLAWAVFSSGVVTLLPDNLRDLTTGVRTKVLVKNRESVRTNGKAERFIRTALREWAYAHTTTPPSRVPNTSGTGSTAAIDAVHTPVSTPSRPTADSA